jgi:hypothetical protein
MEALTVAGGAIGIASLLIQLADQIQNLHCYWTSHKNAPEAVATIRLDLEQFRELLQQRADQTSNPSKLRLRIVKQCQAKIRCLEELVEDLEPGFRSSNKTVRYWNKHKYTQRKRHIEKFQQTLHDAKSDLILANQDLILENQDIEK